MKYIKRGLVFFLMLFMWLSASTTVWAATNQQVTAAAENAAAYIQKSVKTPQVSSIGGEWAILGLARGNYPVADSYFLEYYATVEDYVVACGGVLHEKKYTEYSRLILALTAIGKDPGNVAGYNLLTPLGDFDKTVWQGINGPVWALIALDSGNYAMPVNHSAQTQATRQMYIQEILSYQLSDGGWSQQDDAASAEADITGMALQALAKYVGDAQVGDAVEKALACLAAMQDAQGGFSSWGSSNSESISQVIIALCELNIPLEDSRFVKNGNTLLDSLLRYQQADGSFIHDASGNSTSNQMASEQGLSALIAAVRAAAGQNSLYRMSDAIDIGAAAWPENGAGLPGKKADVKSMPITQPGMAFNDILYCENITAIQALAAREIITGNNGAFRPESTISRAEFAAIIIRGLGLNPEAKRADQTAFGDVPDGQWYAAYVYTASRYGIVNGIGNNQFNPGGNITREQAAAMVARAAKLCGMDTAMSQDAIRNMLAQFSDYTQSSAWAQPDLAFCYEAGILDQSALTILPKKAILRREIAQMLFNLLDQANLL